MNVPPLVDVAQRGGLQPQGRGAWGPCPVCGAERRGREDRRGALTFRAERWRCHAGGCDAGGGAVALLAALRFREVPSKGDARWREVYAELDPDGPLHRHGVATRSYTRRIPARAPVVPATAPTNHTTTTPHPEYPPVREVEALWNASTRLGDTNPTDPAHRYLTSRGIDGDLVGQLDLARVLPSAYPWPAWVPRAVPALYRLVVPVFDATGALRSLRFRAVAPPGKGPKALPPRGFGLSGLVMADSVAQALLRGLRVDEDHMPWDGRVVVAEGETDWWSLAAHRARIRRALADRQTHAVFGIVAGSWSDAIAARIPSGAQVVIWTDLDPAGDRYAEAIRASLASRCDVRRRPSISPDGPRP